MNTRARLTLTSAVLLVGAVTSACGGGGSGAPTDASEEGFCEAATSLVTDLIPEDLSNAEMPTEADMAQAVKDWGAELEEVGTPEDISDEARAGFEDIVQQAKDLDAADFSLDNLDELQAGGEDASAEVKEQAEAFSTYLTDTCGNPMDDIEMPDLELPETTE